MFTASESNIDDLLRKVFERLLGGSRDNFRVESATKGPNSEVFGALLELKNPRARLSRSQKKGKVFSALGELLWYLAGSNRIDFIDHYIPGYARWSDDGGVTANGAYGKRIFCSPEDGGPSQFERVIAKLKRSPDSRNAVIQIFSNSDDEIGSRDKPCTCTLQFAVRSSRLFLHVHMRSNDVFKGLPHDIFAFSMIQEIAAKELGYALGTYQHSVASLHLYDDCGDDRPRTQAQQFLDEGFFEPIAMTEMPAGSQWMDIVRTLEVEKAVREGQLDYPLPVGMSSYWQDMCHLVRAHSAFKARRYRLVMDAMRGLSTNTFKLYIQDRLERVQPAGQLDLFSSSENGG